nr:MAG: putative polyprotein [Picornavirales sp.]
MMSNADPRVEKHRFETAMSEIFDFVLDPVDKTPVLEEITNNLETQYIFTDELIAGWISEGQGMFESDHGALVQNGLYGPVLDANAFIRESDSWFAPTMYRVLAYKDMYEASTGDGHCSVKYFGAAARGLSDYIQKVQSSTHVALRVLFSYYAPKTVPLHSSEHMLSAMKRLIPRRALSWHYSDPSCHVPATLFQGADLQRQVFEWCAVFDNAELCTSANELFITLCACGPSLATPQGVVSGLWDAVSSAWSAIAKLFESGKAAISAIVSPFIEALAKTAFSAIIQDLYPINAISAVCSALNQIFQPIATAFSEVFDLAVTAVTPSSFVEAMNLGSASKKITRWTIGAVSFVILAWLMYRLAIFTQETLLRVFSTVYDGISAFFGSALPNPVSYPQGPEQAPIVSSIGVVLTLCLGLFTNVYKLDILQRIQRFFSGIPALHRGVSEVLASVLALLPAGVARACAVMSPDPKEELFSDMSAWVLDSTAIVTAGSAITVLSAPDFQATATECLAAGNQVKQRYIEYCAKHSGVIYPDFTTFNNNMAKLNSLQAKIMAMNSTQVGRPEPVFLMIAAPAGSGKSLFGSCIQHIFAGIRKYNGLTVDHPQVYNKVLTDDYWSGLQQDQYAITVFDEIWRDTDKVSSDPKTDMQSILLDVVSETPFMPPEPAVEVSLAGMKGTTFNSTLVVGMYNSILPHIVTVNPQALVRRLIYSYELVPPSWNNKNALPGQDDLSYFMLTETDKSSGPELPNELKTRGPGFYCVKYVDDKPDWTTTAPAVADHIMFMRLWRFRRHVISYSESAYHDVPMSNTISVGELRAEIMDAIDLRVYRFLTVLKKAGLRFRVDHNEYITRLRTALISNEETTVQKIKELYQDVAVEIDDFVAAKAREIVELLTPGRIRIEEFSDIKNEKEGESVPQFGPRRAKRVLVKTREQEAVLEQSNVPVTAALLAMVPNAPTSQLVPIPESLMPSVRADTASHMLQESYPWFVDLVASGQRISGGVCVPFLQPDEHVTRAYPAMKYSGIRNALYEICWRVHPNSAEYIEEKKKEFGFVDKVCIVRSAHPDSDGKYKFCLVVCGDAVTSLKELCQRGYTGPSKERWANFYDTCPVHFINFWNDEKFQIDVPDERRYALNFVSDVIISEPSDRCFYPPVLAYCHPMITDVAEHAVTGSWSYCCHCMRFFPPDVYPSPNLCLCGEPGARHELRWFTRPEANKNLQALHAAVPYHDYMYFCAMAANLLYYTSHSNWDHFVKIYQHQLKHTTPESIITMIERLCPSTRYMELVRGSSSITTDYDDDDTIKAFAREEEMLAAPRMDYTNPFYTPEEAVQVVSALSENRHSIGYWLLMGLGIITTLGAALRFLMPQRKHDEFSPESAMPRTITRVKQPAGRPAKVNARLFSATNARAQAPQSDVVECMLQIDSHPAVRAFIPMTNYVFTYIHGIAPALFTSPKKVRLYVDGRDVEFDFEPSLLAVDTDHDLCCFYVPPRVMQPKRDMIRLFPAEEELVNGVGVTAFLRIDRRDYIATTFTIPHVRYTITGVPDVTFSQFDHPFTFAYPIHTMCGDCGSLLRALDGPLAGKVIGYHVAATQGGARGMVGAAAPVYRELIMELIQQIDPSVSSRAMDNAGPKLVLVDEVVAEGQGPNANAFHQRLENISGPNLESIEWVPREERVNVPTKNAYVRTAFADDERFAGKFPSIMVPVEAGDPAVNAFQELAGIETPEIDNSRLQKCAAQQLEQLKRSLQFCGCARELTFLEAVAGIPSLLSSLRLSTSAGYPLVLRGSKGKTSFVAIMPGGEVRVSKEFYHRVNTLVSLLRQHDESVYERYPFYWLAFMKDELRPLKKIKNVATRMIYCNSLEWMVAGRMLFGGLQVAFNNNAGRSIFSAGINVNSHDLQSIADYLGQISLERCIAGDYSGFDKHYHPDFQRAAYANMRELGRACIRGFDAEAFDMFVRHELSPNVQFGDTRMKFKHSHFSGCFFTTAENCLVNELYFMYCFDSVYPDKEWAEETRFVALGDDHLVACSEDIPNFNARTVCELMKSIGQVYTDENKQIPDYDYKPFDECGFLGSTPKIRDGRYAGALRLETLYSNLSHITKETDFNALIETFLDLCSIHDKPIFEKYLNDINEVWLKFNPTAFSGYYEVRQARQIARTAQSGAGFWKPESASDATILKESGQALRYPIILPAPNWQQAIEAYPQGPGDFTHIQGTTMHAENVPNGDNLDIHRAVGVKHASLTSPTQSPMYLTSFEWSSSDAQDTRKLSLNLPGDCIKQAMQQTVPFQYYKYWHGDVELSFQTNGNNFQAGALVAVLCPLKAKTAATVSRANYFCGEHCILEPRQSTSCKLRLPYRYFTDVMATTGIFEGIDILGSLHVYVLTPLSSSSATTVTVTVLVSFPNSEFVGPMPQQAIPQGPNGVTVGDLVGLIPGSSAVTGPIRKLNNLLDKQFIPMDNTPVYNGSIPVANQFPGVSSTVGPKPVVKPTLNPAAFYRKTEKIFEPDETKVASLCAREGILRTFQWQTSQAPGTSLLQIPLNSICSDVPSAAGTSVSIPVCLGVLNMFMYWHADLVFKLYVFKTPFHSGRIRVSLSLDNSSDATTGEALLAKQNMLFSEILDFSDAECCSFKVPFTAAREFLYTASSSATKDTDKIGYLNIAVLNRLVTSTATVSPSVACVLSVSLADVRVAVPHPVPPVTFGSNRPVFQWKAQGPEEGETTVENPSPVPIPFGEPDERKESPTEPGQIDLNSHFPYAVEDVMELARRLEPFSLTDSVASKAYVIHSDGAWESMILYVHLPYIFSDLFMAYSGGIRVRVIGSPFLYSYIPETVVRANALPSTLLLNPGYTGAKLTNWTINDGQVLQTSGLTNMTATEMAYPLPDGNYYIDVELPYEVPVNFYGPFNQIYYHTVVVEPYRPALILSSLSKGITGIAFMGAADDGLYGIFCPPSNTEFWWHAPSNTTGVGALD